MTDLTNGLTIDGLQKLCIERGDKLIAANNQIFKLRDALAECEGYIIECGQSNGEWEKELLATIEGLRCEYRVIEE